MSQFQLILFGPLELRFDTYYNYDFTHLKLISTQHAHLPNKYFLFASRNLLFIASVKFSPFGIQAIKHTLAATFHLAK